MKCIIKKKTYNGPDVVWVKRFAYFPRVMWFQGEQYFVWLELFWCKFVFVNGEWGCDSIRPVIKIKTIN